MRCRPLQMALPLKERNTSPRSIQRRIAALTVLLMMALAVGAGALPVEKALEAPSVLTLTRDGGDNVLSWTPVEGATRYAVYRSATPLGAYKRLAFAAGPSYTHKKASVNAFYKVCAMDGKAQGVLSPALGSVAAVTGLTASRRSGSFELSWKASKYATGYTVETAETQDGPWSAVASGVTATACEVPDGRTTRYYRVVSEFAGSKSGVSPAVGVYEPVNSVKVICEERASTGPTDRLNVQWNASVGATGYEIYRATLPGSQFAKVGETAQTYFADTHLATATYAYKVRPIYPEGVGALSEAATLWSAMPGNVEAPSGITSPSGIVLVVNKKGQVVTAYGQDASGAYTVVLRHMICSTGKVYQRTANGDFKIERKMNQWYQYPSGVYIRYPSVYRNGYYFHSVLYTSGKRVNMSTVSRLGTRQSLGCIRLKVSDAEWVYNHCPAGTAVHICDGRNIPELRKALKPRTVKVNGF